MQTILISALAVLTLLIIVFIIAQSIKNNSIIDIAWGPGFAVIALVSMLYEGITVPKLLLFIMVAVWALRLSLHIFFRSRGRGEDPRYTAFRESWGSRQSLNAFFRVFMLHAVLMMIVAVPILNINMRNTELSETAALAGVLIFTFGLLFESIADRQLKRFKENPLSKGKLMISGLWSISRHPNYFGEIVLWWGIGIYCTVHSNWAALIGPLALNLLIVKVSGIPLLEKKYENMPEWESYKSTTPALIPLVGSKR